MDKHRSFHSCHDCFPVCPRPCRAMLFCHDCQRLHTYACCQSCGLSLCASCLRKAFRRGDFTWDDLYTQCVVCRGLCHCKSCLLR